MLYYTILLLLLLLIIIIILIVLSLLSSWLSLLLLWLLFVLIMTCLGAPGWGRGTPRGSGGGQRTPPVSIITIIIIMTDIIMITTSIVMIIIVFSIIINGYLQRKRRKQIRSSHKQTKNLDFSGFDSSRVLILSGGILISIEWWVNDLSNLQRKRRKRHVQAPGASNYWMHILGGTTCLTLLVSRSLASVTPLFSCVESPWLATSFATFGEDMCYMR